MSNERMSQAEMEAVPARIETDLADLSERVMGHQPLTNAADLVDAAHKRLNETQQRVADLEEWKAEAERESEIDGQMVWTWYRNRVGGVSWDGKDLPEDVRELGHDRMMGWEHVAKMAGAEKHGDAIIEKLNTLLGRAYERGRQRRKLILKQWQMIAEIESKLARSDDVAEHRGKVIDEHERELEAAMDRTSQIEKERDEAQARIRELEAEHVRQLHIVCAERNEAQNNVRIGQARIAELEAERDQKRNLKNLTEAANKELARLLERMNKIAEISDEPPKGGCE